MPYVLFTPPTRDMGMTVTATSQAERAIGRICQPLKVGKSLLRTNGTWTLKAVPTTAETLAVDIDIDGLPLYFAGGHVYVIRSELLTEMESQGIDVDLPDSELVPFYPSGSTFPGSLFPTPPTPEDEEPVVESHYPSDSLTPSDTLYPGDP